MDAGEEGMPPGAVEAEIARRVQAVREELERLADMAQPLGVRVRVVVLLESSAGSYSVSIATP